MVTASATAEQTGRHVASPPPASTPSPSPLLGQVDGVLTLKVRSSEYRGRVLRIRAPKCTIGSHPSCTLRLRAEGVRSVHCVILRGREGTFIRRWAGDTCLNGARFADTRLQAGDRLNIGPIELEVLEATCPPDDAAPIRPAAAATGQQVSDLTAELESLRRQANETESRADDAQTDLAQQLEQRAEQLVALKEQVTQEQTDAQQLREQLVEQQLECEEASRQSATAGQQVSDLTAELESLRRQADETQSRADDSQTDLAQQLEQRAEQFVALQEQVAQERRDADQLREQSEAIRTEHEAERQRSIEQRETAENELRDQRQRANEDREELVANCEAARNRVAELEQLLAEASHELSQRKPANDMVKCENDEGQRELSKWRDLTENVRRELEQEREEHQRVRNEWHVERESLQRELSQRSKSLDDLQVEHDQKLEEAGFLIRSLQQEGKQLLMQLDEAKQAIRRDGGKRKSLQETPPAQAADVAANNTLLMPFALSDAASQSENEREQDARADANVTQVISHEEPNDESEKAASMPAEQAALNQTVMMNHRVFVDKLAESASSLVSNGEEGPTEVEQTLQLDPEELQRQAESASSLEGEEEEGPTEVEQTLRLDPEELQRQAASSPVDSAAAEVTEGVAALLANAPIEQKPEPEVVDDESAIQQYMERLLRRVGSRGGEQPESVSPPTEAAPAGETTQPATEPADPTSERSSAQRPQTEMAADLMAMRELANHSAREAIQCSEQRRFSTLATGRLAVALICLAASGTVLAMSPSMLSPEAIGGFIGLAFGTLMFFRGSYKFFCCRRVRKHRHDDTDAQDA